MSSREPSDKELGYRSYWNGAQPLFAIGHKTGKPLRDPDVAREVQRQIEQAYHAGWDDRNKQP